MSIFTTHWLYTPAECKVMLKQLSAMEWDQGYSKTATGTKQNEEVIIGIPAASMMKAHIKLLDDDMDIKTVHILKTVSPPKVNRYRQGQTYKRHADAPLMAGIRTDLSSTTFLSIPDSYKGGALNVEDNNGDVHTFKGQQGQCVIYPCGQPHWVDPVTEGERISIICWLESHIRDVHQRQLLARMMRSLSKLEEDSEAWVNFGAVHAELFKMWMG